MVKTVKRRLSNPQVILQLWEAITCIRQGKQVANLDRIYRFMERSYEISTKEVQKQMAFAVKEGLLVKELSKAKQGHRQGETQDAFWCAEERTEESEEPHDWYCFECHAGGDVLCCGTCYRVYHADCVKVDDPEKILSLWICPICESCKKKTVQMSKWDLNKILLHVLNRMKEKSRDLTKKLNLNELPNYYNLVYQHMDLGIMMEKLSEKKYRSLEDFEGDANALVHISHIYHGRVSERAALCVQTLKDCLYDLSEIRLCKDCYIMSNDRTQKDWFCKPCHPAHELVWAQMTGFGYWPAKVLQKTDSRADVRFFGSRHERAWIDLIHVRDITTERKKLRLKPSMGWRSAVKELELYKATLAESQERAASRSKDRTSSSSGRKRKLKKDDDDDDEDSSMVEDDDEEEEDALCEARHVIRASSTTDAGQDHSVSTSQTSPPVLDGPVSKKPKVEEEGSSSSVAKAKSATKSATKPKLEQKTKPKTKPETEPDPEPTDAVPELDNAETKEEEDNDNANDDPLDADPVDDDPVDDDPIEDDPIDDDPSDDDPIDDDPIDDDPSDDTLDDTPPPPLEEEGTSENTTPSLRSAPSRLEDNSKTMPALRVKLEADYKKKMDKAVKEALDKAKQEWHAEKEKLVKEAKDKLAADVQRAKTETEHKCKKELNEQFQKLTDEISQTKKKQWCINCEKEAMYHCCWNTSYCSISCQQVHWHQEHKRLCRRKR